MHVLTSQGGTLVCFADQEGTSAPVFQQLGQEWLPLRWLSNGYLMRIMGPYSSVSWPQQDVVSHTRSCE